MTFQSLKVLLYLSYYYIIRTLLNNVLCVKSYYRVNPGERVRYMFQFGLFQTEQYWIHPGSPESTIYDKKMIFELF